MSTNNETRVLKGLEQLGELKGTLVTQHAAEYDEGHDDHGAEIPNPMQTNAQHMGKRDGGHRYQQGQRDTFQAKGQRQQEIREFRHPHTPAPRQPQQRPDIRKPDPEQVLREIQERVNPRNGDIPTLPDFIMSLQDHQFSLEMRNPNQLKRFVKAQQAENWFYRIAYRGGDAYMTALQMYIQYAVDRVIAKRTPPKPQAQKVPREPRVAQAQASNLEVAAAAQTGVPAEQVSTDETSETV